MTKYKKILQYALKNNKLNIFILFTITFFQSLINLISVFSVGIILILFLNEPSDVNFLTKFLDRINSININLNFFLIFFLITQIFSGIITIITTRYTLKIKYIINKNLFLQIYSNLFESNFNIFK